MVEGGRVQLPFLKKTRLAGDGRPRLTGRGWALGLAGVAMVGAGAWFGMPPVVQVGLFSLVGLGVAWGLALVNLKGLEVERVVPPTMFVGQEIPVTLRVRNTGKWLPRRDLEIRDEVAGPFGKGMVVGSLPPGGEAEAGLETMMRERGVNVGLRQKIESSWPCGLWRGVLAGKPVLKATVFPRAVFPRQLEEPRSPEPDAGHDLWQPVPDVSGDYLGIRDYQSGDPRKHIHWRATARTGRLVVREFDRRVPVRYAIFFHSYSPPGVPQYGDAFEAALEMLAGLLLRCRDLAVPLEVTAGFHKWQPVVLTSSRDLEEPLRLLARARRRPDADLAPLFARLALLPAESRVFVLSDTPVRQWEHLLPPMEATVTCLSVAELRERRPGFKAATTLAAVAPAAETEEADAVAVEAAPPVRPVRTVLPERRQKTS